MNVTDQIRLTWSAVVLDEINKVLNEVCCVECPKIVKPDIESIDYRGIDATMIQTILPALARTFNVALACNKTYSLACNQEDECYQFFDKLGLLPLFQTACWWANGGIACKLSFDCTPPDGESVDASAPCFKYGAACLRAVRQILGLYARLACVSYGPEVTKSTLEAFVERVKDKPNINLSPYYAEIFSVITGDWDLSPLQSGDCDVRFRNGPGAVAERYSAHQKQELFWCWEPRYDTIDQGSFRPPLDEVGSQSSRGVRSICSDTSRVALVPKDYRGPRVIAAEPALHAYVQQGADYLIRRGIANSVLRFAVDLQDQSINASAALAGSVDGSLVTIDLSDASDTVRLEHIEPLRKVRSELYSWLMLLRTQRVQVGGKVIHLTSFSPMGSPLTFPVETTVFAVTIISALWESVMGSYCTIRRRSIRKFINRTQLRLYGDDIVIGSEFANLAIDALVSAGFKPNLSKTCVLGRFRESCGTDACHGIDVTPLRPRYLPGAPESSWESYKDMIQALLDRRMPVTAAWLYRLVASSPHRLVLPFCSARESCADDILIDTFDQWTNFFQWKEAKSRYDSNIQTRMWQSCFLSPRLVFFKPIKDEEGNLVYFLDVCRYRAALFGSHDSKEPLYNPVSYTQQPQQRRWPIWPSDTGYPSRVTRLRKKTTWIRAINARILARGAAEEFLTPLSRRLGIASLD